MTNKTKSFDSPAVQPDYSFAVTLMQFLVVPSFVLDAQGRVLIWNKACERLTGILAHEVLGTRDHWRGFYDSPRPCLSDLIVQNRVEEIGALYVAHEDASNESFGIHAENWCIMPCVGIRLYLAIDAGPIYDADGKLLAVVETLRDMTSLKNAQAELEQLATHDSLTGIINRRGFDEKLHQEWSRACRDKLSLSLLMIDVDNFKRFNDSYGHPMGDECLKSVASTIAGEAQRSCDVAARYGGEEFALLLPSIDKNGAQIVAQRILERVSNLAIPHRNNDGKNIVTVSIGGAVIYPESGVPSSKLVSISDQCLYQAKNDGRNCFRVHA